MVRFDKECRFLSKPHALDAFEIQRILELRIEVKLQNSIVSKAEYLVKIVNDVVPILFGIWILI